MLSQNRYGCIRRGKSCKKRPGDDPSPSGRSGQALRFPDRSGLRRVAEEVVQLTGTDGRDQRVLKWHDRNAKDNPPFLDALAKIRDMGVHEGWCYHHVKAILIAIDQYAEAATGNREYFWNRPHSIGGSRKAGDVP